MAIQLKNKQKESQYTFNIMQLFNKLLSAQIKSLLESFHQRLERSNQSVFPEKAKPSSRTLVTYSNTHICSTLMLTLFMMAPELLNYSSSFSHWAFPNLERLMETQNFFIKSTKLGHKHTLTVINECTTYINTFSRNTYCTEREQNNQTPQHTQIIHYP